LRRVDDRPIRSTLLPMILRTAQPADHAFERLAAAEQALIQAPAELFCTAPLSLGWRSAVAFIASKINMRTPPPRAGNSCHLALAFCRQRAQEKPTGGLRRGDREDPIGR
jgi:hypothetical protein